MSVLDELRALPLLAVHRSTGERLRSWQAIKWRVAEEGFEVGAIR